MKESAKGLGSLRVRMLTEDYPVTRRIALAIACAWIAGALPAARGDQFSSNQVWEVASRFTKKPFFPRKTLVGRIEAPDEETDAWRVHLQPQGFIIINRDDSDLPVIGFSSETALNLKATSQNTLRSYLDRRKTRGGGDGRGKRAWNLLSDAPTPFSSTEPTSVIVEPLTHTRWNQWKYYNALCPPVSGALSGYDGRAPVGCTATAMAQLLRLYSWPRSGVGLHTYSDSEGLSRGTYTYDFSRMFPWESLKDTYGLYCTEDTTCASAIAQLMFGMAVAAHMDFEADGSGSSPATGAATLANCLGYVKGDYLYSTSPQFAQAIRDNLGVNQALLVSIATDGGGHVVVADGLATDAGIGYVHVNYGWGGENDGWYAGYDSIGSPLFKGVVSALRPNVGAQPLAICGPNYIELVASNSPVCRADVHVRASGGGTFAYAIIPDESWITIETSTATAGIQATTHQVIVDASALVPGVHDARLTLTGSAPNLPRSIAVRLYKPSPPSITVQPVDQVTSNPTYALLTVTATNGQSFTPCRIYDYPRYQWYKNGEKVVGRTNYWLYAGGYGRFQCEVSGLGGRTMSTEVAVSSVPADITITQQPRSTNVIAGASLKLSVAAKSSFPLAYQWRQNGLPLANATKSALTLGPVQLSQAGNYDCVLSNNYKTALSSIATLTVAVPITMISQPASQFVSEGATASFTVQATGVPPPTYRWTFNGALISGASADSYTRTNVQTTDAGNYRVIASNNAGSVTSAVAVLEVNQLAIVALTAPTQGAVFTAPATITFITEAVDPDGGIARIEWYEGSTRIGSAITRPYICTWSNVPAGSYTITAKAIDDRGATATSPPVSVTVDPVCVPAPLGLVGWWRGEGSATDVMGVNSGVLANGVTLGAGKVGQAFEFDGLTGYVLVADNPSLRVTNGLTIEAWIYPTSLGAAHNIVSKWAVQDLLQACYTTALLPDGRISLAVSSTGDGLIVVSTTSTNSVLPNEWTHFVATYDGSALRTYLNGVCEDAIAYDQGIFPGSEPLVIGAAGAFAAGQVLSPFVGRIDEPAVYSRALSAAEIRDIYNAGSAGKCPLSPIIVTQPQPQAVSIGDIATFTVAAGGTPPFNYHWRLNGTALPMASSASLVLTNVQLGQAGNYDVIVSNTSGSVTSAVASLAVGIQAYAEFDFETPATTPTWLGTTQMVQNTSESYRGTNAIFLTGYPHGYVLIELPQDTRKVEFYFYDDFGPNPPLYAYMFFSLLEATNSPAFAGFTMLDGGWGTTPPMTMNHYYAYGSEEYSTRTMGPLRTIGWHKFAFVLGTDSVAMSVDNALVFQTNTTQAARYLKLQTSLAGGWGRVDDLVLTSVTFMQPVITMSRTGHKIRLSWPISAVGYLLQETISPAGGWVDSAAEVAVEGSENVVLIAPDDRPRFYRLRK